MFDKLGRSLRTTNCIESVLSCVEQNIGKVDYWRNSNQKQRWLAASLLDIEPRLNRICGYKYLPELRAVIRRKVEKLTYTREELTSMSFPMEVQELALCRC